MYTLCREFKTKDVLDFSSVILNQTFRFIEKYSNISTIIPKKYAIRIYSPVDLLKLI